MAILKKALVEDFEKIYPLLLEFNNPRLIKEDWRQLFINHWDTPEDYFGYMLVDNNRVVGFLSLIFSNRMVNGKMQRFCDMGNWIVEEKYRNETLSLLFPVLNLEGYTIRVPTPEERVYSILKMFGFKDLETDARIILPLPLKSIFNRDYSVEFNKDIIKDSLYERDLKIYYDHLKFKTIYLLIKSAGENCYIVINKTIKKRIFHFARVHYISNVNLFSKCITNLSAKICLKLKVCGLLVDERYLRGHKIRYSIPFKLRHPTLFKSESLDRNDIDSLYSEWLVLNT